MTSQLNTLVRLRQYEVDRGRAQLADVIQKERQHIERLAEIDQQIDVHRSQLSALSRNGQLNIDAIRLRQQYLQLLAAQRNAHLVELAAAQSTTREQRDRLIAADQRLQVAEKLRERALHSSREQFQRQETQAAEDAWRDVSHSDTVEMPPN